MSSLCIYAITEYTQLHCSLISMPDESSVLFRSVRRRMRVDPAPVSRHAVDHENRRYVHFSKQNSGNIADRQELSQSSNIHHRFLFGAAFAYASRPPDRQVKVADVKHSTPFNRLETSCNSMNDRAS